MPSSPATFFPPLIWTLKNPHRPSFHPGVPSFRAFISAAEEEHLQATGWMGSTLMYLHAYPRAYILCFSVRA